MAGSRPLLVFRDSRRDRIALQQQQQQQQQQQAAAIAAAAAGFQPLQHPHFSRVMQQRFEAGEEDEIGRTAIGGGGGTAWTTVAAQQHQQRALAAAALRRQKVNSRQTLPILANALIHQGPGPGGQGQPPDWGDGVGLTRVIGSVSGGRMDRTLLLDEPVRLRQESGVSLSRGGEFPRGISREEYAGLRVREVREEFRKSELQSAIERAHVNLLDEARVVDVSRAYQQQRSAATAPQLQQQLESPSRSRAARYARDESGHAELMARYGNRTSSRNLERAHAAIGPVFQSENLSRKRSRDEEADLERERLIRHRKLSAIEGPLLPLPPPSTLSAKLRGQHESRSEIQPKAEYRHHQVDEDEHEEGQITPPPPVISHIAQQHGVKCKTQLFKHEQDVVVINSRTEAVSKGDGNGPRSHKGFPFPSVHGSPPNLRPPTAREIGSVFGDQFQPFGSSKEQSMLQRERFPSPRLKDSEGMLPRPDRVGPIVESYSIFASDFVGMRRKAVNRESDSHTRALNSKLVERDHDGLQYKRPQRVEDIPRRDRRSPSNSRNARLRGAVLDSLLMERLSKESSGRTDNDVKRKIPKKGAAKDSRLVGEMTISVQKHGQRTVKVEEYKSRDLHTRVASQTPKDNRSSQRGGSLRGLSDKVNVGRDRSVLSKRKDCEGRPQVAAQDKALRSNSSKVGKTHLQHLQGPTLQDRVSPYSQHDEVEVVQQTEKYEREPHKQQSIFSRLVGFRHDTTSTSPRTVAQTSRLDSSFFPVNDKKSVPSSSRKSPVVRVQASASNVANGNVLDFQGFQVSSRSSRDTESGCDVTPNVLINASGKNSVLDWPSRKQVEQFDTLNRDSLKFQTLDVPRREELACRQQLESGVGRSPHLIRKECSPLDKGMQALQNEPRLLECSVFDKPNQSKLRLEGVTLSVGESGIPFHLHSADMGPAEICDQSPGKGFKSLPKVISTGHKKDQVSKKSFVNDDQAVRGTSSSPIADIVLVESNNQEKSEGGTSIVSAERTLVVSGCREETQTPNSVVECSGSIPSVADCEPDSTHPVLGDNKPRSILRPDETVPASTLTVGAGSTHLLASIQPPNSSWKPTELNQFNLAKVSKTLSDLENCKEGGSLPVASDLIVDGELGGESSTAPTPSSTLSTPKEVRLFGANLNAPVTEKAELTPEPLEVMDDDVVVNSALPAVDDARTSVSLEKAFESVATILQIEEDICLPVVQTGDEKSVHPNEPAKAEEKPSNSHNVAVEPLSLAHGVPLMQVQSEELASMPQDKYVPPPNLQKTAAIMQGRQPSSSHGTVAHTWHRGTSTITPVQPANIFRGTSAFGGVIPPAGRAKSALTTAYVRKGNSLVRAPGAAIVQSANEGKVVGSVMSGQVWPLARQLPMMKPVPFRNTFIANTAPLKVFYPSHRKYVAVPLESDKALMSSVRPVNPQKLPNSSSELGVSSSLPLAALKAPPQVVPKVTAFSANTGALLKPPQEQQTGALFSSELPVVDGSDDNLGEAGVSRAVNDTASAAHSMSLISVPGNPGGSILKTPVVNRLYVRRKANQLVVAPAQPANFLSLETESSQDGKTGRMPGHYFKRKTNQLARSISGRGSPFRNVVREQPGGNLALDIPDEQGGQSTLGSKKMRLGRVLKQKKGAQGSSSWVWTLSGAAVGHASDVTAQSLRTGPLLPWKRQNSSRTPSKSQRLRPLPEGKKGSLLFLMSKRLRKVRPVQPVYTRSADGFSLHRSGVMSLGGGNLKWTKSLEKRAKQASEEVTKAVAEAERRKRQQKEAVVEAAAKVKDERRAARKAARGHQFRSLFLLKGVHNCHFRLPNKGEGERIVWVGLLRYKMDAASKTLQRMPDLQGEAGDTDTIAPVGWAKTSPLLTPRRSIIGGTLYLRVGNGNQLVRDPKAASRALASEKVRWSLHNARSRGAKKQQQYCQFFTKFGKCNKESGKCSYIHDPDKVAVCTKYLKGNCTDSQCLLTHKVIPERMSDCSFFLEGLCTNENCPYRHVNVNPKAPYCDGFLRGYCKDGDKCNKKHTYVCSVYAETGECLDRSTCKFHHPKKKDKPSAPVSGRKIGTKRKRRYFSTVEPDSLSQKIDPASIREDSITIEESDAPFEESMEFISLNNIESDEDQTVLAQSQPPWRRPGLVATMKDAGYVEDIEKWIRPTFLMQTRSAAAAAH